MKALPMKQTEFGYVPCEPNEATHVQLHMPGPIPTRIIPVMIGGRREGTPNWTWNGNTEKPTLKPSILTRGGGRKYLETGEYTEHVCHSFVNDGMVQFLTDSNHEFSGQTVSLLDVE